jgi:nicotinic acid mononucleotide adenylyltransferase
MVALEASQGVLVVEQGHPHRSRPVASLEDRRRLVQQAVASSGQMSEAGQLGLGETLADTTSRLLALGCEVHAVFGADSARRLDRWGGRQRLAGARLWWAPRAGEPDDDICGVDMLDIDVPSTSATEVRCALAAGCRPPQSVPGACRSEVVRIYAVRRQLLEGVTHA